jgi:hypothetical protein
MFPSRGGPLSGDGGVQCSCQIELAPACVEIRNFARVGLSESEALQKGIQYRLATIPMAAVLRTRALSETRGFLKTLIDANGDRTLGFSAFGVDAGEIMGVMQLGIRDFPYTAIRHSIFSHPTIAGGLTVSFFQSFAQNRSRAWQQLQKFLNPLWDWKVALANDRQGPKVSIEEYVQRYWRHSVPMLSSVMTRTWEVRERMWAADSRVKKPGTARSTVVAIDITSAKR